MQIQVSRGVTEKELNRNTYANASRIHELFSVG